MLSESFYCINLEYAAIRQIKSLPGWHGARWHALMREACHSLPFVLEDLLLACKPSRYGKNAISAGERLKLLLLVRKAAWHLLPPFLESLAAEGGTGEFSAASLKLLCARDAISGQMLWKPGEGFGENAICFRTDFLEPLAEKLASLAGFSLRFSAPLRLPLPPGHPQRGEEQGKYAGPEFLASRCGLQWLLRRLRFMRDENIALAENLSPVLAGNSLRWVDMRYGQQRHIALGGIIGEIAWRGRPDRETALRLVLGSCLGAGKNPRFGLGFWSVSELSLA